MAKTLQASLIPGFGKSLPILENVGGDNDFAGIKKKSYLSILMTNDKITI
jgi:hypothetical protein